MDFRNKMESIFLSKQAVGFQDKCKNIALAFVLNMIWVHVVVLLLGWIFTADASIGSPMMQFAPTPFKAEFFFACVCAPIFEEVCFRYVPYKFADLLGKDFFIPTLALSCWVFGWMHGNGFISLLIQGVGGLFLSWVYINNGRCLYSSIAAHAIWNIYWTTNS